MNAQGVSVANLIAEPNPPDDEQDPSDTLDRLRALMVALYGMDFPLVNAWDTAVSKDPQYNETQTPPPLDVLLGIASEHPDEWAAWVRGRWGSHDAAVQMHLWLCARNRLYRANEMWVSSTGIGSRWTTPPRDPEKARVVVPLIGPALDQRLQVIREQRPGFEVMPVSNTPDEQRKAQGRQVALEYHWHAQGMDDQVQEAGFWSQTDGAGWWHTTWDRNAGPLDARMGKNGAKAPMGDLRTTTLRVEQVRVSSDATANAKPREVIIRDLISQAESASEYGISGVGTNANEGDLYGSSNVSGTTAATSVLPQWVLQHTTVGEGNKYNNIPTVERFTVYLDKQPDILPDGLQLVTGGDALVWGPGELLFGVIPVVRLSDGSTDPSYYPRPIMEQWIPSCMAINAATSLWVNNCRLNSGGQFAIRTDALSRETFIASGRSLVEVDTQGGPIGDTLLPINGFSVGSDTKDLIAFQKEQFEALSGYNEVSRGAVSNETATAVATANENLQRTFAPVVNAIARAAREWAEIQIAGMAWGYDIPRDVGVVGADRPDLARALSAADFDGPASVRVDAEKMMPMPKVYRMAQLNEMLRLQVIDPRQYKRLIKFADVKSIASPDEDQEARANRVADAIRMQLPPEQIPQMRWTDDESIFQDVIQRKILLQDDLPQPVIDIGMQIWTGYAQQAAMKAQSMAPPPQAGPSGSPDGAPPQEPSPSLSGDLNGPLTTDPAMGGGIDPVSAAAGAVNMPVAA